MKTQLRILNLDPKRYSPKARSKLEAVGEIVDHAMDRETLLQEIGGFDILIMRFAHRIDREVLQAAHRLKVIASNVTGIDHIDEITANNLNISIICLKGEYEFLRSIHATAELTWGLLLSLMRLLPHASNHVQQGGWNRNAFIGHELAGKTLGVLGFGRIGEKVARYGIAFNMNVLAYDPHPTGRSLDNLTFVNSLIELCIKSDILSIHIPLNKNTWHLIGRDVFDKLPNTSVILNTSRSAIIDQELLLDALINKQLAGAALDVVDGEHSEQLPPVTKHLLEYTRTHSNLIITPHIGGVTWESWEKTEIFIADKVCEFFDMKK